MALLFVVTGLGVGVYAFWQATHQKNPSDQAAQANNCLFSLVQNIQTLPPPEVFKPAGDVTKLETADLEAGSGKAIAPGDCVTMKYYGTLAKDGKVFDEDFTKPEAIKFKLGTGQVIPGWDEGLNGMKVGGLRRLVIPSDKAYGPQSNGQIPANSDLVFVVKLVTAQ
jgi:peptidylprolyl isomerase